MSNIAHTNKRIATPEFWRFVFVMGIVFGHFEDDYLGWGNNFIAIGGYLGVEFFLLLSGFAIAWQYESTKDTFNAKQNWLKRFKNIYPDYIWSIIVMTLVWIITDSHGLYNILAHIYKNRMQLVCFWPIAKYGNLEMRSLWYVGYWLLLYGVIVLNIRWLRSGGGEWLQ